MRGTSKQILFIIFAVLAVVSLSAFTVFESERAIISRLGKLQAVDEHGNACQFLKIEKDQNIPQVNCKPIVLKPGLHFKFPFMDSISVLDARLLMSLVSSERIPTKEKKDVIVDLFVKWRIRDFGLFYLRTNGNQNGAEQLLKQKVVDGLRAAFGQRTIKELVSGREQVMDQLKKDTSANAERLGIEVKDVRIKRIDFPPEVSDAVYKRMRTDRETAAVQLRANGESEAEKIRAEAEKERRVILAKARKEAEETRGAGDANASTIYSASYSQSPEFFEFYQSLNAYKESFKNSDDVLVIEPSSDFFKYFRTKKGTKN